MQNWIDRAISWVSPQWGLQRSRARLAQATVRLAYEGAKTGRRTSGWSSSNKSANAEIGTDLATLRERSRELVRNNHFAAKAALEFAVKTVGAGITARTQSEQCQAMWELWQRECSADGLPHFAAIQSLVARTVFEAGECLVRRRTRTQSVAAGMSVPIQLQVLEPDFLDMSKTSSLQDGGYIIHGVEFNSWGQRVAYWLFPQHPGEVVTVNWSRTNLASTRVPADEVLHIFDVTTTRPGQVRGVPHLAPVMLAMRDLDDWEDAELVRKKTEACLAAFIFSSDDNGLGPQTNGTSSDGVTILQEQFQPGMLARLRPGEDVKFNQPAYAGGYADYKRSRVRDLATGMGMLYEILAGDLSQTNYSSYRSGLLAYRDRVQSLQWNVFVPMLCDPVWRWFVQAAEDFAGLATEAGYPVAWGPPPFDLLDREAEAKADQLELMIGKKSWPQLVTEQGEDPRKQLNEIQQWKPQLDAAGVIFNPKAGATNENGQATNPTA